MIASMTFSHTNEGLTIGLRVVDYGLAPYSGTVSAIRMVCTSALSMDVNATITHFAAYKGF